MGLFGLLGIARDGVAASSAALTTTGSNVSNVATPGYARRTVLLETATVGGGVRYLRTERNVDRFAQSRVIDEQGKKGAADARSGALSELESIVTPPNGSFGEKAIALVRAFNALSGFPIDPSLRADVVDKADKFAASISTTRASLEASSANMLGRANDMVSGLNDRLTRIADLNKQVAMAVGSGADSGALRDQRDQEIKAVGEAIGARSIEDANGRVTLFAAGAVLVAGDEANKLQMDLDPNNGSMRFYASGASRTEITSRVDTGTLGGLREARDIDLAKTRTSLDSYAFDVANAFNTVHTAGFGLDGTSGRPLFNISGTANGAGASISINADLVGHPERIATSSTAGDLPGGNGVALQLANLAATQSFGGATLADRFASMATDIGFRKSAADAESTLRMDTLAVAESLADSANGVSLDEEMVNLQQYQRAFEASTKVLRTADELLQQLMDSL